MHTVILCCRNFWQYSEHIQSCIIQVVFICQITLFQIAAYVIHPVFIVISTARNKFFDAFIDFKDVACQSIFSEVSYWSTTRWINIGNASAWNFRLNFCPCQPRVSRDEGVFRALSDKVLNDTHSANMCLLNCWYETIKWA